MPDTAGSPHLTDTRTPPPSPDDADTGALRDASRRAWHGTVSSPVEARTSASPDRVWDVLADGWTYASWVVGASRIRAVSADWPARGALLEHSVGAWPCLLDDCTISHGTSGRAIRLEARGQVLGRALVEISVLPDDDGARVVMAEEALTAPARLVPGPLRRGALALRNQESLRRLTMIAERATDPRVPGGSRHQISIR